MFIFFSLQQGKTSLLVLTTVSNCNLKSVYITIYLKLLKLWDGTHKARLRMCNSVEHGNKKYNVKTVFVCEVHVNLAPNIK